MNARIALLLSCFIVSARAQTPVILPDSALFADNVEDYFVETTIPGKFKSPEGVIGALLTLGDQAANRKLDAPFKPETIRNSSHFEGALPLAAYYRGAKLEGKEFTICFSGEAMRYLNNAAAIQGFVKGAIHGTILKNFPGVEKVHYEVDGEIVEDWDA